MRAFPLRLKLLLASLGVVVLMLALLLTNSVALLQRELLRQAELRVHHLATLLDASLAVPMAQRDYAAVQQALELIHGRGLIRYLLLRDHQSRPVAAAGWPLNTPPPLPDSALQQMDMQREDATYHARHVLVLAGQELGTVHFGFATDFVAHARRELLRENLPIVALLLLSSAALLAAMAYLLTRQLDRLDRTSHHIAEGDFAARVPIVTGDELGRVSTSFNRMADAVELRIAELQASRHALDEHLSAMAAEQARLASLLHAMPSGVLFVDGAGRLLYANHAFARIWRLPGEALAVGRTLQELLAELAPRVRDATHLLGLQAAAGGGGAGSVAVAGAGGASAAAAAFCAALPGAGAATGAAIELQTLDERTIVQRLRPITEAGGRGPSLLVMHDDITAELRTRQRAQLADRDALTGLLNRRGFIEALHAALAQAPAVAQRAGPVRSASAVRASGVAPPAPGEDALAVQPLALLFVDLDDFKAINDRYGHRVGDELLRAVAAALQAGMRRGECVARLGGDEFAVLCVGVSRSEALAVAPRLVRTVAGATVPVGGLAVGVGCSVGLTVYPGQAAEAEELLAQADLAMYHAKGAGKNGWARYEAAVMAGAAPLQAVHDPD